MAESIDQLKQAIANAQGLNDKTSERTYRYQLAQQYVAAGQHEAAITELSLVVRLDHDSGDKLGVARTMLQVGKQYAALNNRTRAKESYDYALTIAKMFGDTDIIDQARKQTQLLNSRGSSLLPSSGLIKTSETTDAKLQAKDRVIERAPLGSDKPMPPEAKSAPKQVPAAEQSDLISAGQAAYDAGRVGDARKTFEEALEAGKAQGDERTQAQALFHLGLIEMNLRRFDEALQSLQDAVGLTVKTKDYALRHEIFDMVINIFESQDDAKGIQNILKSKLDLYKKTDSTTDQLEVMLKMADMSRKYNDTNQALYQYEDALSLAEEANLPKYQARALLSSGEVYCDTSFPQLAVQRFRDAREAARRAKDRKDEALSLIKLASAYCQLNDWDAGLKRGAEALEAAKATKSDELIGMAQYWLAKLYSGSGDAVSASRADKQARELLGAAYQSQ